MKYAHIDDSEYPLVYIRIQNVEPTFEIMQAFFLELESILAKHNGIYVTISDNTNGVNWINKEMRSYIAERGNEIDEEFEGRNIGGIVVLKSASARIILKGINLFLNKSVPQYVMKTEEEARIKASNLIEDKI